jgi:hypothetical protein
MKKLITICAVLCLMLISTSVSWAVPVVQPPPGAPSWWNQECIYYAYGWWSADIIGTDPIISPPDNPSHWASNFLSNTDFKANIGVTNQTITVDLDNVYRPDLYKEIYIYITGTTTSTQEDILSTLDTDGGTFTGSFGGRVGDGLWSYVVSGEIHPQPDFVNLRLTVPGMTSVTNIWAGENCIPEPATICMLGLGALSMIRRKKLA